MSDSVKGRATAPRAFDGIICIGGSDWWYHNRGHFDLQIMRRLAHKMPVLYVNSLGVRMPSLTHNGQFGTRMSRKLKSLQRGLVNIENKFSVFSPVMVPGGIGIKLSSWALAPQIRMAARRCGINKPLLWVHCPAGAPLIDDLGAAALVLQRTDRFESFPEADGRLVAEQIAKLKSAADLVVYVAEHLQKEEAHEVHRSLLVTHGVDFDAFMSAGKAKPRDPIDMVTFSRPRVGFVGSIDSHTFDPDLFLKVAADVKEATFVMAGGCSLPDGWCTLPNVKFLGRKPYEEVARTMAACDALIMPWNDSDWIKACNPIKLKEYLAVGRPIVTRDFPALDGFRDLVRVANSPESFAAAIRGALTAPHDPEPGRQRISTETWDSKAEDVRGALERLMSQPVRTRTVAEPAPSKPVKAAIAEPPPRAARRPATLTAKPVEAEPVVETPIEVEPVAVEPIMETKPLAAILAAASAPTVAPSPAPLPIEQPPLKLRVRLKPRTSRVHAPIAATEPVEAQHAATEHEPTSLPIEETHEDAYALAPPMDAGDERGAHQTDEDARFADAEAYDRDLLDEEHTQAHSRHLENEPKLAHDPQSPLDDLVDDDPGEPELSHDSEQKPAAPVPAPPPAVKREPRAPLEKALSPQERKRQQLNAIVASARESVTKKRWYQFSGGKPAKANARSGTRKGG